MPTLTITKSYQDGDILFEADLDNIKDDVETFVNTTGLDDDNLQNGGITASDKIVVGTITNALMANNSVDTDEIVDDAVTEAKIIDEAITEAKMALINKTLPIGSITMFHTFNSTVSIPRGWMKCNGDVVNATNYDAIHTAGNFATDGVGSAALNGKNLPNLEDRYPVGAASTTQDGSVAITEVGNTNHEININHTHTGPVHNHQWYSATGSGVNDQTFDVNGNTITLPGPTTKLAGDAKIARDTSTTSGISSAFTNSSAPANTGASLPTNQDVQPASIEVIYIIKVV